MAMKYGAQALELAIGITQAITVSQVELFAVYLGGQRFAVKDDTAFLRQVVTTPDVMVTCEEMYFHSEVRQFGQLAQETCIAFGHH